MLAVFAYAFFGRVLNHIFNVQPGAAGGAAPRQRTFEGDDMVQDPHCKVYVPINRSVPRRINGSTVRFCSEECANKYLKGIR